jgi:hypothetical protein
MSGTVRTIATVLAEARTLLQDKHTPYRYTDDELLEAFNGIVAEIRAKRPDMFLGAGIGLRDPVPYYTMANTTTPFPLPATAYNACLYYVVGRSSLRDDTYADDSRAVTMMNKAVTSLLTVAS